MFFGTLHSTFLHIPQGHVSQPLFGSLFLVYVSDTPSFFRTVSTSLFSSTPIVLSVVSHRIRVPFHNPGEVRSDILYEYQFRHRVHISIQ